MSSPMKLERNALQPGAKTVEAAVSVAAAPPVRRKTVLRMLLSDVGSCIALALVVLAILCAVLAPWLAPTDPFGNDLANTLKPPGDMGLLGTDAQGRSMITRLLYGLRTTLLMGSASVAFGCAVGGISIREAMRTIWPFFGASIAVLLAVTYIPSLSLWLPSLFR